MSVPTEPSLSAEPAIASVRFLCLDERQHPVFQVQMHVRCRIPLAKIMPMDAVLPKFRIAQLQLHVAQLRDFVAPFTVGCAAANHEWFHATPKILIIGQLAPVDAERLARAGTVIHG